MFRVLTKIADVRAIEQDLNAVYQKHRHLSFYTPRYTIASFEHFLAEDKRNDLFFVVNKIQNEITHYIPWYIDSQKTLRFIFDKHTDYCSCIGPDMNYTMLKDLTKLIIDTPAIRQVELENLLPDDALLNSFKHFLGMGTVISCYNNHSFITSTTSSNFYSHLKSNEKSELKRVQRKNETYNFEVFDGGKAFPKNQIQLLRDQMIANKARNIDFFDETFVTFSGSLYDAGELEVFSKWDREQLISASMVLKNDQYGYRMVWVDLYADIPLINLSAYIEYIHYLEQSSPIVFSFGRGSYDYKAKNFQPDLQNLYNLRYSRSKFNFFFSHYQGIKQFGKRLIRERK